jgi:hypothetical protein
MRFTEVRRSGAHACSPSRSLERDGLIDRRFYPVIPPRVDYTLTNLGESLLDFFRALIDWSTEHTGDILAARERYDAAQAVIDAEQGGEHARAR